MLHSARKCNCRSITRSLIHGRPISFQALSAKCKRTVTFAKIFSSRWRTPNVKQWSASILLHLHWGTLAVMPWNILSPKKIVAIAEKLIGLLHLNGPHTVVEQGIKILQDRVLILHYRSYPVRTWIPITLNSIWPWESQTGQAATQNLVNKRTKSSGCTNGGNPSGQWYSYL